MPDDSVYGSRKARLEIHPISGDKNALQYWAQVVNPLKVVRNFLVIYTCRFLPSLTLKNWLYRRLGMKVGRHVSVGLMAMFAISLYLIYTGRNAPLYQVVTAMGLLKYSTWTISAWVIYWSRTADFHLQSIVMTVSHIGLLMEGLVLLAFLDLSLLRVLVSGGWYLLSDWVDYGLGHYPGLPAAVPVAWMEWHTVAMTLALTGLFLWGARRKLNAC